MAQTRTPAHAAAARGQASVASASAAATAAATAHGAATNFDVELARSLVSSSLGASQGLFGLLDQLQQLNMRALKDMSARLNEAVAEAGRAHDLQQLLAVPMALASSQMASAAQAFGAGLTHCLDAEAQFIEQAQEGAARLSRQVLGEAEGPGAPGHGAQAHGTQGHGGVPPAPPATDAPVLAWIGQAQNALTEMTGRWVEMAKVAAAGKTLPQF